jgi:hypothetical protein
MQIEEAKDIVRVAASFVAEQDPEAEEIRLEQIEQRPDGKWSVVLSFARKSSSGSAFSGLMALQRVYKELVVNDRPKEVTALKMWK